MSVDRAFWVSPARLWYLMGTRESYIRCVPVKSDPREWKDPRHRRGLRGEQAAMRYLRSRGWRIAAHRFRMGRFELDLVVRQGRLVAFVEVKTRRGTAFGGPFEAVGDRKRRELARVARAWIDRFGTAGDLYRFDVIGITLSRASPPRVDHLENAFWSEWR